MKLLLLLQILAANALLQSKKPLPKAPTDHRILANVKIYSNLAEIIQPLGKLPLEFSSENWSDIRTDSITLVGLNLTVTQQTITEKKKSLNNVQIYVRSPSSSNTETKFLKATMIDENRNLVKLIDKDISKDPIFLTVQSDHIVYDEEPPQSKYYVDFTYNTSDAVHLSYLRSNLNWKTLYQLNLFEESKNPVITAVADIRNDGKVKIDIEHAELLGGDINLRMIKQQRYERYEYPDIVAIEPPSSARMFQALPSVLKGEEIAGLYVFTINQPFSIDGKTNYLIPMFRPQVIVERYGLFQKSFSGGAGSSNGKAQRSYRLSSDRFLSRGNCIIREYDRLVGETLLPDLAAKDKHEFSVGEDADIVFKENVTLVSSRTFNDTSRPGSKERTQSVYNVNLLFKNFKKNRSVKVEYKQAVYARSVKLTTYNTGFIQDGSTIKATTMLSANGEKLFSYKIEVTN